MPRVLRSRTLCIALLVVLAACAAVIGETVHMGYWGGPVFTWVPATARPAPADRRLAAIYLSGDAGFNRGLGPRVAARLAARGIPVLGVNSLTAFGTRQTPAQTAGLVRQAATTALARSGAAQIVLMGQSFGANALLAGVNALPPAIRAKVRAVVLVVPADTQLLHASPGGFLDFGRSDGPAIVPARALNWAPVSCIHGETEQNSLCPAWHARNVAQVTLPGDHFLRHDDAAVARAALSAIIRAA